MTARPPINLGIKVVGFDPSMNNWGIAHGTLYPGELNNGFTLLITDISVTQPVIPTGKQVRQNNKDLEAAKQLSMGALAAAQGAKAIFVEVPHGSQSARAMASYGLCVGVLGSLRASGIPFFEVSEGEVKLASLGKKSKTTKLEMIQWAMAKHPEANWPTYKRDGKDIVSESKAEHMADAIAAIYAGIASNSFQQVLPFLTQQLKQ